jgi:hypothetical protein
MAPDERRALESPHPLSSLVRKAARATEEKILFAAVY